MIGRSLLVAALTCAACVTDGDGPRPDADPAAPDAPPTPPDADPATPDAAPVTPVTPAGGTLEDLRFAVVGDTQPPDVDDTAGYPTGVITTIWQDVQDESPRPAFAVTTGDYMFASTSGTQQNPQLDLYLSARSRFSNIVFHALGNHECTGYTADNCGPGSDHGSTRNYTAFLNRMVAPLGHDVPWYSVRLESTTGTWDAKLLVLACNAWSSAQEAWLDTALDDPTTYTFVVRHEGTDYDSAPCVRPSAAVLARHAYTLVLVGHAHTFAWLPATREVIVGNGGAPLSGSTNHGYAVVHRRADGVIVVTAYDYQSRIIVRQFAVNADGTPAS